jgi:hypothetical protein
MRDDGVDIDDMAPILTKRGILAWDGKTEFDYNGMVNMLAALAD